MLPAAGLADTGKLQEHLVGRLCAALSSYLEQAQVDECLKAYEYGAQAHEGQYRKSGEDYICHPVSVAIILAEMHMDINGVMAGILHDVMEDCDVSKKQLAEAFNPEVAELVDGVTKLTQIGDKSRAEAQAENVRKMFLPWARICASSWSNWLTGCTICRPWALCQRKKDAGSPKKPWTFTPPSPTAWV